MPAADRASSGVRQAGHGTAVSSTRRTCWRCRSTGASCPLGVPSNSRLVIIASRRERPGRARPRPGEGAVSDGLDAGELDLPDLLLDVGAGAVQPAVALEC